MKYLRQLTYLEKDLLLATGSKVFSLTLSGPITLYLWFEWCIMEVLGRANYVPQEPGCKKQDMKGLMFHCAL